MKKILAIFVVAVLTLALCIGASANYSLDRLFVNQNDRVEGDAQFGATPPDGSDVEINAGDKLYIIGWAVSDGTSLSKIVYTVNGGSAIECTGGYRDRPDVAAAFGLDASAGTGAGFGFDAAADGGMMELTGVDSLAAGSYDIVIKAVFADGSEQVFDTAASGMGIFKLVVNGAAVEVKSDDQWLCGTEYDASKTPCWWFNPLCNAADDAEGRHITVNFVAAGYFSGFKAFCFCNPGDTGSTKVELIQSGSVVATAEIVSSGDKEYEVDFGKSFAAGTYSLKFSPLTGTGVEGENWFVLGGFSGSGEDVSVDTNVNFSGTDATQPCIMLVGATGSGSTGGSTGGKTNPRTGDAAVIAIAAVAVVALAGVVVAKKVK